MGRIGNYEIIDELGRGAMGVVYRAVDPAIGRSVAIKVLRSISFSSTEEEDELLRLSFAREAAAAGKLTHPNIVTVFHVGEEQSNQFLVMEYIEGKALDRLLMEHNCLDAEKCVPILTQLANALDYAHSQGVLHRDIKPANILIRDDGLAKITDFGIARITNQNMTKTGTTMGTPAYMAPEQVLAGHLDGRADQFSLAVVAFELLTGRKPFQAPTENALMFAIVSGERPLAHVANPKLTPPVSEVLRRGMSTQVSDRYASCGAFVVKLEEAFTSQANTSTVPYGRNIAVGRPSEYPLLRSNKGPDSRSRHWAFWMAGIASLMGAVLLFMASHSWRSSSPGNVTAVASPPSVLQPATSPQSATHIELKPQGYVSDYAGVLPAGGGLPIEAYCESVERATGAQIAVVLVPSLEGESIENYASRLFRQWGIGHQTRNDGLLLLLAVSDHSQRLEIGYGLENIVPNSYAAEVLHDTRPMLQQGDYAAAILTALQRFGGRIAQSKKVDLRSGQRANPNIATQEQRGNQAVPTATIRRADPSLDARPGNRMSIESHPDVRHFLGLQKGDGYERAIALFGKPFSETVGNNRINSYFGPPNQEETPINVNFDKSTGQVRMISTFERSRGTPVYASRIAGSDPLLILIGKRDAEIRSLLGQPAEALSQYWHYDRGKDRLRLDFNGGRCIGVAVSWDIGSL